MNYELVSDNKVHYIKAPTLVKVGEFVRLDTGFPLRVTRIEYFMVKRWGIPFYNFKCARIVVFTESA